MKKRMSTYAIIVVVCSIMLMLSGCEEEISTKNSEDIGYLGFQNIPTNYTANKASEDGCVVYKNITLKNGREKWDAFALAVAEGKKSNIRIYQSFGMGKEYYLKDLYYTGKEFRYFVSLDPKKYDYSYKYMLDLNGTEPNSVAKIRYVVLTNDKNLTFEKVYKYLYGNKDNNKNDFQLIIEE